MIRILAASAVVLLGIGGPSALPPRPTPADASASVYTSLSVYTPVSGSTSVFGRSSPGARTASRDPASYTAPVPGSLRVVRDFDPPITRYGPGHLGVDLGVPAGQVVQAAGAGVVRFAGSVAGRGVVVVAHPDGISTEYEPVRPLVRAGASVARGQPVGVVSGAHADCAVDRCLHWGAKRGTVYIDPLTLLVPLGPVRLLPWTHR